MEKWRAKSIQTYKMVSDVYNRRLGYSTALSKYMSDCSHPIFSYEYLSGRKLVQEEISMP